MQNYWIQNRKNKEFINNMPTVIYIGNIFPCTLITPQYSTWNTVTSDIVWITSGGGGSSYCTTCVVKS